MLYIHNTSMGINVKGQTKQSLIFRCIVALDLFHNRMHNFFKMKTYNDTISQAGLVKYFLRVTSQHNF